MQLRFLTMCVCFIILGANVGAAFSERTKHRPPQTPQDLNSKDHSHNKDISHNKDHHQYHHLHHQNHQNHQNNQQHYSCPNCLHKTEKDAKLETEFLRLEAIKRQILSKLGMREKPNITHPLPRELVERTYKTILGEGGFEEEEIRNSRGKTNHHHFQEFVDADDDGRTTEIIAFAEQGYRLNGNRLLEFRINTDLNTGHEYRVKSATLWIKAEFLEPRPDQCPSNIYVFKFRSMIGTDVILTSQQFNEVTEDPTSVTLDEKKPGWQKIDLRSTIEPFLKQSTPDSKLKLFVDCSCCGNWRVHVLNKDKEKRSDPNRPFLVIEIDPSVPKRIRRRSMECNADTGNQCCKQQFYVSFEKLGWREWIIAPSGYYANYCKGECGFHRTPDTYVNYHTHVIEQFRKNYHLSGVQPCCAPLKFSSISLIYYDTQHNIIKRDLPKMVVDDCGCP